VVRTVIRSPGFLVGALPATDRLFVEAQAGKSTMVAHARRIRRGVMGGAFRGANLLGQTISSDGAVTIAREKSVIF
jgi:hypothetical protein